MHFGQRNCTMCPPGYLCPSVGMFFPTTCPRGFTCNEEGQKFALNLCPPGSVCLGGVKSGAQIEQRSCKTLLDIKDAREDCAGGVIYFDYQEHEALDLPEYGFTYSEWVCC